MANLKVKDADAGDKYLAATGAGTDIDPHIVEKEVVQATPDDLNCNANLQVADADVANGNPVPVSDAGGSLTVDGSVTADCTGSGDVPVTLDGETVDVSDRAARDLGKVDVAGIDSLGSVAGQATKANSLPVTLASDQEAVEITTSGTISVDDGAGSLTVDGTVNVAAVGSALPAGTNTLGKVGLAPQTSGGLSIFRSIDLDETEEAVKASAGQVFGWFLYNLASSKVYIKFYNATVATVVVGTTTPVITIPLDADQGANVAFPNGIAFSTAITVAATTGVADNDTGAPGANEVIANVFYK